MKLTTLFSLLALAAPLMAQGPLTPSAPPAPSMKTLQQIEPRIDLATVSGNVSAEKIISTPGSYFLSQDLTSSKPTIILIRSDNVTIDLQGFQITGNLTNSGVLIEDDGHHTTIQSGTFKNLLLGIKHSKKATNTRLSNLRFSNCSTHGAKVAVAGLIEHCEAASCGHGFRLDGLGATLSNSRASNCTIGGVHAGAATTVDKCSFVNNGAGTAITLENAAIARDNLCTGFSTGIFASDSNASIIGNTLRANGTGLRITTATNCVIEDNNIVASTGAGFTGEGTADYNLDFSQQRVSSIDANLLPGSSTTSHVISSPGHYHLSRPITTALDYGLRITTDNVTLDLNGHSISGTGPGTNGAAIQTGNSNIKINNGSLFQFSHSIDLEGAEQVTLSDMTFRASKSDSLHMGKNSTIGCRSIQVTNVNISRPGNAGVAADGLKNAVFSKVVVDGATGDGFLFELDSEGIILKDCQISECENDGIKFMSSGNGSVIERCSVRKAGAHGINMSGNGTQGLFTIRKCTVHDVGSHGINIGGSIESGVSVLHCQISKIGLHGINISSIPTDNISTAQVVGCLVHDAFARGITLSANGGRVLDNLVNGTRENGTIQSDYRIIGDVLVGRNQSWTDTSSAYSLISGVTSGPRVGGTNGTLNSNGNQSHPLINIQR